MAQEAPLTRRGLALALLLATALAACGRKGRPHPPEGKRKSERPLPDVSQSQDDE